MKINDDYKIYSVIGHEGSNVHRGFVHCGSLPISYVSEQPDIKFIKAGSLDDSSWLKIESNLSDTANHWDPVDEKLPTFEKIRHFNIERKHYEL